ncbi:Gti1/Pac2 family-domain-containing protein [Phellopilus nigrolimitatus]|nr:Gti1/Pac2 family-domain-containing protein [Phellopilus nigrolimitatus]
MRPSQRPTITGVRVRSTRDANVLFHAVACGILPMVTRRLDAADRAALRSGCVYVWEERSPASDATGAGMERFTEGRHWHPSRVRDDFLLYVEKDWDTNEAQAAERSRMLRRHRESYPSTSYPIQPSRRQPLVKQTYSAWVNNGTSLKKWHMNAYYTEDSLEKLHTVDEIRVLSGLHVPHECYQRARSSNVGANKKNERGARDPYPNEVQRMHAPRRDSTASQSSQSSDRDQSQSQSLTPLSVHPRYAPFPPSPVAHPHAAAASSSHLYSVFHASPPRTDSEAGALAPLFLPSQGPYRSSAHGPPPSPSPSSMSSLSSPIGEEMAGPRPMLSITAASTSVHSSAGPRLVPLEHLRAGQSVNRREPADDEILRSFRLL